MKKKRLIKKISIFIILLLGTFGICLISTSNTEVKAYSNDEPIQVYQVNAGTFVPNSSTSDFTNITTSSLLSIVFSYRDENTGDVSKFNSMYLEVKNERIQFYINRGEEYNARTSIKLADSSSGDWCVSAELTFDYKQTYTLESGSVIQFLMQNYSDMIELRYRVEGRYKFHNRIILSTNGILHEKEYNLTGYFQTPLKYTADELKSEFEIDSLRAGDYYLTSFKNIRLSSSTGSEMDSMEFNYFIPKINMYGYVNMLNEEHQFEKLSQLTIYLDSQNITAELFTFLYNNGVFYNIYNSSDDLPDSDIDSDVNYTPTDLLFAVVDIPIHYLQSLLSFELFNTTFWVIFSTLITLALVFWIIKGRSKD